MFLGFSGTFIIISLLMFIVCPKHLIRISVNQCKKKNCLLNLGNQICIFQIYIDDCHCSVTGTSICLHPVLLTQ